MGDGIQPVGIADGERAVELILRAQCGDGFWRDLRIQAHLVEIVSGSESGEKESQHGDAEEEKDGMERSAQEVTHQEFTSTLGVSIKCGVAASRERVTS